MKNLTRRQAIRILGAGSLVATLSGAASQAFGSPAVRRPNVLILVADDQQPGTIGMMGHPTVQTPHLDALVRAGTSFTNACNMGSASGPVCIPARAMLLTGRPLYQLRGKGFTIPPEHVMLPELLRSEGYTTFGCGKWHNDEGSFLRAFSRGEKIFFGGMLDDQSRVPVKRVLPGGGLASGGVEERFSTEVFADAAVEFLTTYKEPAPFVCYAAFTSPHDPRTPPAAFKEMYPAASMPLPANFEPQHRYDIGVGNIRDETLLPCPRPPEAVREELSSYFGMISHLDSQVGRILQALRDSGHEEDTIIIYTSDHGLAMGQHGLMGKQNVYQASVGVPLVIKGPQIAAGARSDALCYSFDLFPTLCERLGLPCPPTVRGRSYAEILKAGAGRHRDELFFSYSDAQRAVRDSRFKLIEFSLAGQPPVQLLFDVANDPGETRDLAQDPAFGSEFARMRKALNRWAREVGKPDSPA